MNNDATAAQLSGQAIMEWRTAEVLDSCSERIEIDTSTFASFICF